MRNYASAKNAFVTHSPVSTQPPLRRHISSAHLVLKSLGVAGDTDAGVTLVESLDDLVTEVVDDLYLAHFGRSQDDPPLSRADALSLARAVVANPSAELSAARAARG